MASFRIEANDARVSGETGEGNQIVSPPHASYGEWPAGSGHSLSFFAAVWPYIVQWDTTGTRPPPGPDYPFKMYMAPADSRNPGTDGTISYCSNATVLSGRPRLPSSFYGKTATTVCVMERSGMDGAHTWSGQNNYLGAPGAPPPFPQIGVQPSAYLDGSLSLLGPSLSLSYAEQSKTLRIGGSTYTIGLGADIYQKHRVDLKYIDWFGRYRDNGNAVTTQNGFTTLLKDRGFQKTRRGDGVIYMYYEASSLTSR